MQKDTMRHTIRCLVCGGGDCAAKSYILILLHFSYCSALSIKHHICSLQIKIEFNVNLSQKGLFINALQECKQCNNNVEHKQKDMNEENLGCVLYKTLNKNINVTLNHFKDFIENKWRNAYLIPEMMCRKIFRAFFRFLHSNWQAQPIRGRELALLTLESERQIHICQQRRNFDSLQTFIQYKLFGLVQLLREYECEWVHPSLGAMDWLLVPGAPSLLLSEHWDWLNLSAALLSKKLVWRTDDECLGLLLYLFDIQWC